MVGLLVLLLAAGVVVYGRITDDRYPDEWDPRVTDLVDFVESERGLSFEHPVHVEFLTPDEYSDEVRIDDGELTDEDAEMLEEQMSFLRALGLAAGEIDAVETMNDLADAGTLAYYDLLTNRVVVRGTELTVDVRVTLVHELTHVLQDQHFDLEELQGDLDVDDDGADADAFTGYQAMVEGDAVRIENAYVESLSDEERDDYVESYNEDYEEAEAALDDVPAALQAFTLVPYVLGQPLIDLIAAEGGNLAVDEAFERLPSTGEHMLDPRSYFDSETATELDEPELPDDVDEELDSGVMGAVDLYVVLAERIDPLAALEAADGWGNARYVSYEDDGRTCVAFAVTGDTTRDQQQIDDAWTAWVAEAPRASDATVDTGGDLATVSSCDPGTGGELANDRAMDALLIPALRSQLMTEAVDLGGLSVDDAWDESNCVVETLGYEDALAVVSAVAAGELPAGTQAAFDSCIGTGGA